MDLLICMACSAVVSAVITKILANRYFEIVDGYVKDMIDNAKKTMVEIASDQGKL